LRASLLDHAQRLVRRDGAAALTMRNLAAETGCAIGLPYTVFPNREALVTELVALELVRIREQVDAWLASAGSSTVAENLDRYASLLLDADAPSLELARSLGDAAVDSAVVGSAHTSGLAHSFEHAVAHYLLAEQRLARVAADVDAEAFGFLITGAVHNLVEAGAAFPRPSRARLRQFLFAIADRIIESV
jgi:AcrR family transcriptional regulator